VDTYHLSSTYQEVQVLVSDTADATGYFTAYFLNLSGKNGEFFDFPNIGIDQDAVILTGNVFQSESDSAPWLYSQVLSFAKARLYNGISTKGKTFNVGGQATVAPPIVLDDNARTFLVQAPSAGSAIRLYRLTNSSRTTGTGAAALVKQADIAVRAYSIPPDAPQAGTFDRIATLDARFQNLSTQVGTSLWQTHTVDEGDGFATVRFYEFNTQSNTVKQFGQAIASGSSYDFNPAISARVNGTAFLTWTATDPSRSVHAQMRVSGRRAADPAGSMNSPGTAVSTSSSAYHGYRWGDYATVAADRDLSLSSGDRAIAANEVVLPDGTWGTQMTVLAF
jgi:hypothetical protein